MVHMNYFTKYIFYISIFFICVACQKDKGQDSVSHKKQSNKIVSERIIPVEGIQVKRAPINASIQAIAVVEAKEKATLRAFISGMVSDIKVEEGDLVKSGDLLARLSRPGVVVYLVKQE